MQASGTLDRFRLDGRVAFVCGGARGIGFAIAKLLAEAGATVHIGDVLDEVGKESAERIAGYFVHTDVTSTASVNAAVDGVLAIGGGLDVAVNCAGIRHLGGAAELLTDEEWDAVMDINLNGVFRACRAEGRAMLAAGRGAIVNIASMSGSVVNRPQPQATYNVSKAAVAMLTKSLAVEWAERGVRVNSISPGYVETDLTARSRAMPERVTEWLHLTPMNRMGQPDEIAGAALYLVSDASSYATGTDLVIDGGYTSI
jgi:NAD(P)-dependent dehydrogenase (short-subunit alcohol dehydrogenase family)